MNSYDSQCVALSSIAVSTDPAEALLPQLQPQIPSAPLNLPNRPHIGCAQSSSALLLVQLAKENIFKLSVYFAMRITLSKWLLCKVWYG